MLQAATDGTHPALSQFLKAGSTVIVTGRREQNLKDAVQRHPGLHYVVSDASGKSAPRFDTACSCTVSRLHYDAPDSFLFWPATRPPLVHTHSAHFLLQKQRVVRSCEIRS